MVVAVHDAASPGAEQSGVLDVLVQAGISQFRGSRKADTGLLKRDHPSHTKQSHPSMTRRGETRPTDEYSTGVANMDTRLRARSSRNAFT